MSYLKRKLGWFVKHYFMPLGGADEGSVSTNLLADFLDACRAMDRPRVLELGVKRDRPDARTRRDEWIPNASEYIGTDIEAAQDVDVVSDAHRLSETFGEESFDIILSVSTFEHIKYPQLAAHEMMKTLKVGGILFLLSHQAYPLHGAPSDFYRFSRHAFSALFGTQMGFEVLAVDNEFPAMIKAREAFHIRYMPAFLNTRLYGRKTGKTPAEYIYEFDVDLQPV